jgi:acetyl esterase
MTQMPETKPFGTAPLEPAVAGFLAQAASQPPLESLPLEVARQSYRELAGALSLPPPQARVHDFEIPGPGGSLQLRSYTPVDAREPLPVVVFLHGGGWVIGDLETHDAVCRTLCHEAGRLVVAVHYRRAPEHRFPAAPDDAEAALRWVAAHAAEIGGDPARLALAGDSAGAQMAVVVAQRVAPGIALRGLGLIYPAAQHYSVPTASYAENGEGKFLTTAVMRWFVDAYLGPDAATRDHPEVSLLRSQRLHSLPATWIATLGHDPLRDEGLALARMLAAAGVPLTHVHEPSGIHACIHFTVLSPAGARLLAGLAAWLRDSL